MKLNNGYEHALMSREALTRLLNPEVLAPVTTHFPHHTQPSQPWFPHPPKPCLTRLSAF
ncbi:hypothetical protein MNY64_00555 [Moellerella wisconsensis]|uniref:hypothetical protein n=1 Tax=Moellerella wisconsensis TaxID=158849 RepID=UPI001F4E2ADD|nr:hypothetical protein [Moellerella wisconsensis]UNH27379.1 hypothetical protein MNY64_00555 [Moellerella wisconsensis]